jgi:small subunit ribosomal protein S17
MKTYQGIVISDKMDKTIIVEVARNWVHPIYKKTVKRTKKYPVHDESSQAQLGDKVSFVECRPYSKTVHFSLTAITEKATKAVVAQVTQETQAKETAKKA